MRSLAPFVFFGPPFPFSLSLSPPSPYLLLFLFFLFSLSFPRSFFVLFSPSLSCSLSSSLVLSLYLSCTDTIEHRRQYIHTQIYPRASFWRLSFRGRAIWFRWPFDWPDASGLSPARHSSTTHHSSTAHQTSFFNVIFRKINFSYAQCSTAVLTTPKLDTRSELPESSANHLRTQNDDSRKKKNALRVPSHSSGKYVALFFLFLCSSHLIIFFALFLSLSPSLEVP